MPARTEQQLERVNGRKHLRTCLDYLLAGGLPLIQLLAKRSSSSYN